MDAVAFLKFLLPQTTPARFVVAMCSTDAAGKEHWFNRSASTPEKAARAALGFGAKGFDTFHACAAYDPATKDRRDVSVVAARSLYLDLDVARPGSNKPNTYASVREAFEDLQRFVSAVGLPSPNALTSSGWGAHAYWVLDRDLPRVQWLPLAHGLRNLATQHGLKFDGQVTTTLTRVLRTPGTWNYKNKADPKQAHVIGCTGQYVPLTAMQVLAQSVTATPVLNPLAVPAALAGQRPDDLTRGVYNRPSRMEWLLYQCPALQKMALNGSAPGQGSESRELWLAMLGVAAFTEDGHQLIGLMSRNHHAYDPQELARQWSYTCQKKAEGKVGPGTCMAIAGPGGQAAICATCPHNGQIASPIVLGYNPPSPAAGAVVPAAAVNAVGAVTTAPLAGTTSQPAPPDPQPPPLYSVMLQGGFGTFVEEEDPAGGQPIQKFVPIMGGRISRIERRLEHSKAGDQQVVLAVQYHKTPSDITGDMLRVPLRDLSPRNDAVLGGLGFVVSAGRHKEATYMLRSWSDLLAANTQRNGFDGRHYGWDERDGKRCFVLGDRVYWDDGRVETMMTPPPLHHTYDTKGTFEAWRQAAQTHHDAFHPALQTLLAASFAAPLVHLSGRSGGRLLSIVAPDTGVGKTTASDLAQTVWGDPVTGTIRMNATVNAVPEFAGQLKSLPVFWDEARGTDPQAFMNLMFSIVEGRGRMRLNSSAEMRETASWNSMVAVSSNFSVRDRAGATEAVMGEGPQRARVFECHANYPAQQTVGLHLLTAQAVANRGHAGAIYAQYLATHWGEVSQQLADTEIGLTKLLNAPASARFHVSTMSLLLVGACLSTALGLIRFDVAKLRDYLFSVLGRMLVDAEDKPLTSHVDLQEAYAVRVMEEFLSAHIGQTLVTNSVVQRGRPGHIAVIKQPARQGIDPVVVQAILQQGILLIDTTALNMWLVKTSRTTQQIAELWRRYFGIVKTQRALGAGTIYSRLQVYCTVVPSSHPEIAELIKSYAAGVPNFDPATIGQQAQPVAPVQPASPYVH